jgi:glycosyltransferase involved in cell wall biosynthesis
VRILVANKFWYHRGGLERVMFDEIGWLEAGGHEIAHFSTQHPQNEPSPWSDYFVPYLELGEGAVGKKRDKALGAARMFYNREAARRFTRLLLDFRPDVVHVHGIHRQLSPSILVASRDRGVPVVQTLHDYHPICAGDRLLRGNGAVCDPPLCRLGSSRPAMTHRCVRGSLAQSVISAAELTFRQRALHYERLVTAFISPSRFLADTIRAAGLTSLPVHVIPNAIVAHEGASDRSGFVFASRLSHEKGLAELLDAADQAQIDLTIAGDGPLANLVRERTNEHVTWLGAVPAEQVIDLLGRARTAVVPSTCIENAPLAVLEPMACGTPVVASRVGGIPELVRDGVDGLLIAPASAPSLAEALRRLAEDDDFAHAAGASARERIATDFTPVLHVERLLAVYGEALGAAA